MSINSICVSPKEIILAPGKMFDGAKVTAFPDGTTNPSVTWESSNNSIATVDATGKISASEAALTGTVTITAKLVSNSTVKDHISVIVGNSGSSIFINSIVLNKNVLPMIAGNTSNLIAAISPTNASSKALSWHSSNDNVAIVNSSGMVTAINAGTAVITAVARDGSGVYANCSVVVIGNTIPAVQATSTCYIRLNTVISNNTILKDANGNFVTIAPNNSDPLPLLEKITVGEKEWYKVLYNGMLTYVTADSFEETTMIPPSFPGVCDALIYAPTESQDPAIRSIPSADGVELARYPHMSTVRLMNRTSQKIEYTTGWFAIRGTTTDGNEIYGWIYGNYVYSIYEADDHSLSDSEIQAIVNRLENTSSIVASKRNTAARIAQTLLENGYAPSFAAGMIANSIDEGTIGRFEVCSNPPQTYLEYVESNYNYTANYNYKTIMDVNVNTVMNMLQEIKTYTAGTWKKNNKDIGFSLGCIQWFKDRAFTLVKMYLNMNGNSDSITLEQATLAETNLMILELSGVPAYRNIHTEWKDALTANIDSENAAEAAGRKLCSDYIRPASSSAPYNRGERAKTIFNAMMGITN